MERRAGCHGCRFDIRQQTVTEKWLLILLKQLLQKTPDGDIKPKYPLPIVTAYTPRVSPLAGKRN
jgi:hypothetical protein